MLCNPVNVFQKEYHGTLLNSLSFPICMVDRSNGGIIFSVLWFLFFLKVREKSRDTKEILNLMTECQQLTENRNLCF